MSKKWEAVQFVLAGSISNTGSVLGGSGKPYANRP